ncbi:hypothetical protein EON65_23040 [archaeon]|nr:MAG: hypothetical protein EON65_23040 [archaeon]
MSLEVNAPQEFQGTIMGGLNKRGGLIMASGECILFLPHKYQHIYIH